MKTRKSGFILFLAFLTIFCLSQAALYSQPLIIGVKGGLSIPDLSGGSTPLSEGYTSRRAPTYGAYINYELNPDWFLQAEVLFSGQGGQRNGIQPIPSGSIPGVPSDLNLYANYDNETIINYLEIPLLVGYTAKIGNTGFTGYVDAGPYLDILINAETKTSGSSDLFIDPAGTLPLTIQGYPVPPQSFNAETNNSSSIKTFNVGIAGGVGIKYNIGCGQLDLNVRGEYGFIPVESDVAQDGSNHSGALYITLGYGIRI
jgi:hypothetical protein